jgi:hypothetical protein
MKKLSNISFRFGLLAALSLAAAMWSGTATAAHVSVGIYAGAPAPYYAPPPVVYAPQPYYAPAPVYVGPRWERTDWRARREWRERQWRRDHYRHDHGHGHGHGYR